MLKDQDKNDVYEWLVEITEPVGQQGPVPHAGAASLTVSAVMLLLAALGLFLHM